MAGYLGRVATEGAEEELPSSILWSGFLEYFQYWNCFLQSSQLRKEMQTFLLDVVFQVGKLIQHGS